MRLGLIDVRLQRLINLFGFRFSAYTVDMPKRLQPALSFSEQAGFLPVEQLGSLVEILMVQGYQCLGPAVENGAIVMRELDAPNGLTRGLQAEQAPGRYRVMQDPLNRYFAWANGPQAIKPLTFASRESLWRVARDEAGTLTFAAVMPAAPAQAIIGVRACDLAALALQDAHFLQAGRRDPHYAQRRESLFLVAVQCAEPGATCFCASTGDGPTPTAGFDLSLAELAEGFVVVAGSAKGEAVLNALNLPPATAHQTDAAQQQGQRAVASQTRSLPAHNLREVLMRNLEHPRWDEVAARCLACGNCTAVCPTCFCHAESDVPSLDGHASIHERNWDSCFGESHGHLHGFNVRPDIRSRYRQWLTHKLATWHDQFGRSGCVGCGRCIAWCPVGIDLTEEVAALTASEAQP
jgi:sulfhydrogenase subunit beta (sulfur reductase)